MSNLLQIASRVEAAVGAYKSVQDVADKQAWKAEFMKEMQTTIEEFHDARDKYGNEFPLHPTLVALSIVLDRGEDLCMISRTHPSRALHCYYYEDANFPDDISDQLPPAADHWWERLAKEARGEHPAETDILQDPPPPKYKARSVKLNVPDPPDNEGDKDVPMSVDKEPESRGRSKVAKGARGTKKRRGSSAAPPEPVKRRTKSGRRCASPEEQAEQQSNASKTAPIIQCRRCMEAGEECIVLPSGACKRCNARKQKCTLLPVNPETGKTDRRPLSAAQLEDFRIQQTKELRAEIEKGKQRAGDPHDGGNSEDSAPVPSPLAGLSALGSLTLESGGSSAGNTPSDSPAVLSQPSTIECPSPALPPAPTTRRISRRKAGFAVEVPSPSHLLIPPDRQTSRSRSDASLVSDDGSNSARIAALETRQDELEKRQDDLEKFVHDAVRKLKNTGA